MAHQKKIRSVRLIAYYLPQFHPIPENDLWQGKGFTEWTNVTKAKPLFWGHYQPHIPADLGFYDLRLPETRIAQADIARKYGIEGFCYWHYWLGNGKRLLERPFQEVLLSGQPNFPFCLGWANHSWTDRWFGKSTERVIVKQTYPGQKDHEKHFYYLLKAFSDDRYLTIDEKPIFVIFRPYEIPNIKQFTDFWRELAYKSGLKGLHLVGENISLSQVNKLGFDATTYSYHKKVAELQQKNKLISLFARLNRKLFHRPMRYSYKQAMQYFLKDVDQVEINEYPCIVPRWDNTPRCNWQGLVLTNSSPELFRKHLKNAIRQVNYKDYDKRILFVKSWNEWAEGNYLEPDQKYGKDYLEVLENEVFTIVDKKKITNQL